MATGNAVTDLQNAARLGRFHRSAKIFNLLLDD
jgi:hypothetical protein